MPLMTQRRTVKNFILFYLKYHPGWQSGLTLENQAQYWASKPSIVSRRARELYNDGKIERRLDSRKLVQYRLK